MVAWEVEADVVINELHYHPADPLSRHEFVELYNAGERSVDVSNWSLHGAVGYTFPEKTLIGANRFLVVAEDPDSLSREFEVSSLGPLQGRLSNEGETLRLVNQEGQTVDAVAYRPGFPWPSGAVGEGSSLELVHPGLDNHLGGAWRASGFVGRRSLQETVHQLQMDRTPRMRPTPGKVNSTFQIEPPPVVLGVGHHPRRPTGRDRPVIEVATRHGTAIPAVVLLVQTLGPGQYQPSRLPLEVSELRAHPDQTGPVNEAFADPDGWQQYEMRDDGIVPDRLVDDGVFTVQLPALPHRTLVRYRVEVVGGGSLGQKLVLPFTDDPRLNFAYFVYDGVPAYQTTARSLLPEGKGSWHSVETMTSLPIYHLLTREEDFLTAHGYDPSDRLRPEDSRARRVFNWEGALVYDGTVYDHVRYRLRQKNDRYNAGGGGKRALRFRFNRSQRFRARDERGEMDPVPWRTLNLSKLSDGKRNHNFGLPESMNSWLWNLVDVPAPRTHYVQLRVVDRREEAPGGAAGQYHGDFWGMFLAIEDYDSGFVARHELPDGNLYRLKDGTLEGGEIKRHQGRESVPGDQDFQNILQHLRPERNARWLRRHVDFERWNRYHAVAEAVRHYDYWPNDLFLKNRAWFFEPSPETPLGKLWVLPWDSDTTWGPTWGEGVDYPKQAIFGGDGKPGFKTDYRNFLREFRDLVWTREMIEGRLDVLAALIGPLAQADLDRWIGAPFGRDPGYRRLEKKVADMKAFAFEGWEERVTFYGVDPAVPEGGRARFLETLAASERDGRSTPDRPVVHYVGPLDQAADELVFLVRLQEQAFESDPTRALVSYRIRLADVSPDVSDAVGLPPGSKVEWPALWRSREIPLEGPTNQVQLATGLVQEGREYRLRSQVRRVTGQWSRWSEPVAIIPSAPGEAVPPALRLSEILYHPHDDQALEFVELANLGKRPVFLNHLELRGGVRFDLADSRRRVVWPGDRLLIVQNEFEFARAFPSAKDKVLGQYGGRLANGGERLNITVNDQWFQSLAYDDDWYPPTDGEGFSLEVVPGMEGESRGALKEAWRASQAKFGTPGTVSTRRDVDGDGLPDLWEIGQGLDPRNSMDAGELTSAADGEGRWSWFDLWSATRCHPILDPPLQVFWQIESGRLMLRVCAQWVFEIQPRSPVPRVRFQRSLGPSQPWEDLSPWMEDYGAGARFSVPIDSDDGIQLFRAVVSFAAEAGSE